MRFLQAISEAPIGDLSLHGDGDEGSFRDSDLRGITAPGWDDRVRKMFQKAPVTINVHLLNAKDNMIRVQDDPDYFYWARSEYGRYAGPTPHRWVEKLLGHVPANYETGINVILTQNEGDERLAMTPWMLGHRIIHALFISRADMSALTVFNDFIRRMIHLIYGPGKSYELWWRSVATLVGTMKSAREDRIVRSGEFFVDLGTQVLAEGKIRFNRVTEQNIEEMLALGLIQNKDHIDLPITNAVIQFCEQDLTDKFTDAFKKDVGRFYTL